MMVPGGFRDIEDSIFISILAPIYIMLSLTAIVSRFIPLLKSLSEHGKTLKIKSSQIQFLWISKRNFRHFYFVGLFSLTTLFGLYSYPRYPSCAETTVAAHLLRRTYECIYVHHYGPTSKMHIAGWLLGMGHYLILPFVFVGRHSTRRISLISVSIVIANTWFQYEQYQHHLLLAGLRRRKGGPSHPLPPPIRWFRSILCPHYLAEILLYFTWALMLHEQDLVVGSKSMIDIGIHYRHWFLFLWVATNLTVSSLNNYEWYKARHPKLTQSALVPHFL
jgi:3-oxo-5-alpha-steroid 4-dehydrogenase 3